MAEDIATQLAQATSRCYLEAPAGFGKTEVIADAVKVCHGKQLVLTHTHAGVDSLRRRLKAKAVPPSACRLETISAWSLRLVAAYPQSSGYIPGDDPDWRQIYDAMIRLLAIHGLRRIMEASYAGVIVDEYQDCTEAQHRVIEALADVLPVRVVGDPLQGIFGFGGEKLVDWKAHIYPTHAPVTPLSQAWRWENHNKALGQWLVDTRSRLQAGQKPDYSSTALAYSEPVDGIARRKAILNIKPPEGETLAVLVQMPGQAHALAQDMPGFTSMEEIECRALLEVCEQLERATGATLIAILMDFVKKCCTNPEQSLDRIRARLAGAGFAGLGKLVPKDLTEHLEQIGDQANLEHAEHVCILLATLKGRRMYRHELFYSLLKTLRLRLRKPDMTLREAARQVRERVSRGGRKDVNRLISRVLLVKGLEYDHVVVLDPSLLTTCELYVALTRGRKSLTVIDGPVPAPKSAMSKKAVAEQLETNVAQTSLADLWLDTPP